jgi:hypothetical protein
VEPLQQDTLYYVLMVCDNLYIASDHEVILLSVEYRKRRKSS